MNKFSFLILIILQTGILYGQKPNKIACYSNQLSNIIFVGVSNPVTFQMNKANVDYSIYSLDAEIQQIDSLNLYYVTTRKIGKVEILVANVFKSDTISIDTILFESIMYHPTIKYLVDTLNFHETDLLTTIPIFSISFIPWIECKISFSYDIFHIRNDSSIISFHNNLKSSKLNQEIINSVKSNFQKGDNLLIINFKALLWGTYIVDLPSKRIILDYY